MERVQLCVGEVASKLVRLRLNMEAKAVVGLKLDSLEAEAKKRMMDKLRATPDNPNYPPYDELWQLGSFKQITLGSLYSAS